MELLLGSRVRLYELLDGFGFGSGNILDKYHSRVHVPLDPKSQEPNGKSHVRHESLYTHGRHEGLAHDVVPVMREITEATVAAAPENIRVGKCEH